MTSLPAATSELPRTQHGPHDLRQLFRAVGRFSGQRALNSDPIERTEQDVPVEMLEEARVPVTGAPLEVSAFVDGVQASLVVAFRAHRPVYLSYTAAGAVGLRAKPLGLRERLEIVCSGLDREWVEGLGSSVPIHELAAEQPQEIEREAIALLGATRDLLERDLVGEFCASRSGVVVLDGSLAARPHDSCLVGVVKTVRRRYLADEGAILYGMPAGWRSPIFKIPAGSAGAALDRYSCYVRLHSAEHQGWSFGLIRLESHDPDLLEPLAARCLKERQSAGGGDARWDRHLQSVRAVEDFLRARRPEVFSLAR